MKGSLILQAVYETPWAILPGKLLAILDVVHRHAAGELLPQAEIDAIKAAARKPAAQMAGAIAVLPVFGTIFPRANLMTEHSGGASAEGLAAQFRALVADPNVGAIVLDVDSPGGAVSGIDELGTEIFKARGTKPIVAQVNHLAASAAYWVATAADEMVVTPSGEVGSIGVFAAHQDVSAALEREGVKVTLISAGKFKTEGNPYQPLGEEARAAIESRVADYYGAFTKAVARNRGVSVADVQGGFGEGRVVGAKEAVRLGMADRVGTLEETLERLMRGSGKRGMSAEMRQRRARAVQNW